MRSCLAALLASILVIPSSLPASEGDRPDAVAVTFLGTGTPSLDPARYGAATLVEAGDRRLLFDVGRGATIRLRQAGLAPIDVDAVFLTHFHSDHVVGLPDLFLSRIILDAGRPGSNSPLRLFGPPGTGALADGLRQAFAADLAIRRKDERSPEARMQIRVVEMDEGVVFDEDGLRVTMFRVDHGEDIRPAVGYRIDFRGRSVVLSGDTRYDPSIAYRAKGVDLLVHETAVADEMIAATPRFSRILAHHTSPQDVGRIFASAAPKLAAVSHIGMHGAVDETDIAEGVRISYRGPLLIAQDLTRVLVGQGEPVVTRAGDR